MRKRYVILIILVILVVVSVVLVFSRKATGATASINSQNYFDIIVKKACAGGEVLIDEKLAGVWDQQFPDWGLSLSVKDVTSSGLTLLCTRAPGESKGTVDTGIAFRVLTLKNGRWSAIPEILDSFAWPMSAYDIPQNQTTELEHKWEAIYGKLPPGKYRFLKDFSKKSKNVERQYFTYWVDFEIK